jgi:hypothetical protein
MKLHKKKWTEGEIHALRKGVEQCLSDRDIADSLGRSEDSVSCKSFALGIRRRDNPRPKPRPKLPGQTLCWRCARSGALRSRRRECSWMQGEVPVEGWVAQETAAGYRVFECPLFSKEDQNEV